MTTSIYVLRDPRTSAVRYVGKSVNPKRRYIDHCGRVMSHPPVQSHTERWIDQLRRLGLKPIMQIVDICEDDWADREIALIALLREMGCDLTNMSLGGEGWAISPEARKRAGEKLKNRYFSPEHRAKISAAKKGKPRPDADALRERGRRVAALLRGKPRGTKIADL